MTSNHRAAIAAALLSSAALAACGSGATSSDPAPATAAATPAVTVESCGRTVTVDTPPRRALTMEQNATEILLSLGLADRMAGTAYQTDPPLPELADAYARVERLADLYPSRERVLQAEPDFVYSTYGSAFADDAAGSRASLEQLDVPSYLSANGCEDPSFLPAATTFDQVFAEIEDLAAIFGVQEAGADLVVGQRARLEAARAEAADAGESETLLWYYSGTSTPYFAGCCGMPSALTELVGARQAFGEEAERWFAGTWESVAALDPSVIVLADLTRGGDGDSAAAKERFLRTNPVTREMRAVREGRFVVVAGSETDPNVRSVLAAEKLAAGLRALEERS